MLTMIRASRVSAPLRTRGWRGFATETKKFDYDYFVIGAGSGGVASARRAAMHGAKVGLAESGRLGGTCVNVGCVPKKLYVYASHFKEELETFTKGYGWKVPEATLDWGTLKRNKDAEIKRLNGLYENMLDNTGVDTIRGWAKLVDENTVAVDNGEGKPQLVTAKKIMIAVGSKPFFPSIPGIEHALDSDDAFEIEELPKSMVIVGGGYIATEFACIFHNAGVEVTQVYRGDTILRGFDDDIRSTIQDAMLAKGMPMKLGVDITSIEKNEEGVSLQVSDGSTLEVESVMYATGRVPLTEGLGLEKVGMELNSNGSIKVDEYSLTSVPSIYAVGDVTGRVQLTPVAIQEGRAIAETLYNNNPSTVNYDNIPSAIFSQPEAATVGLTETEARKSLGEIEIYKAKFRSMKYPMADKQEMTLMKVVVDKKTDVVVGVHMVGECAGEIVQCLAIALQAGATKTHFDNTMALHPSISEEFVLMQTPVAQPE